MRLCFFRQTPGALGIKVSNPNPTVTSSAITPALLELTLCQPVVRQSPQVVSLLLPRHRRGILFSHRWPVFAVCSQGTCTTKWQAVWLEAYRLVQPNQAGYCTATHRYTVPKDHNSGPQKQASYSLL